jgi:uncharacterized protein (TIGR02266 family)
MSEGDLCEDDPVSRDPEATFTEPRVGTIEDREEARVGVDLTVTVDSDSNFYAGVASNLSAGGIFVATHIVHPVGTRFNLSLHLGDNLGVVRGVGEVRWIRAADDAAGLFAGLGIRFLTVDGDGAERITRFLSKRAPLQVGPSKAPPDS